MPEIMQYLLQRRSIRKYTSQPVSRELLRQLLQAAMAAPSASNSCPWEFIVVTEAATFAQLRRKFRTANYNATAAIVIASNLDLARNAASKRFWEQDCSAATENILIAAAGLGLGAVWIGVYPLKSFIKRLADVLAIPPQVTPLAMVYLGYPAEEKPARTQYDAQRVHWERY
ncbi:MAG: nitroreductase family protein [Chloroflexota bacterium]|nr:nitroreductase family protein [Chloroflexota bacterium]